MDAKKTNLTPELKEIYDRVMNTSGKPAVAGSALPTSVGSTPPPPPPSPLGVPPAAAPQMPPAPMPAAPNLGMPPMTGMPTPPAGAVPPPPPASGMPTMSGMPSMPPPLGTPAEQALSSAPARPVAEGNTFSFSGTAHQPAPMPQAPGIVPGAPSAPAAKKKTKISLPILIVLGLVFLIVWGVFWAIIFGFIKR